MLARCHHVFTCSLGNINCSHANNTIDGLICVILNLPVVAVFLREDLARNEAARTKIMLEQEHCCLDTHEYCHSDALFLIGLNAHEVARATKYIQRDGNPGSSHA